MREGKGKIFSNIECNLYCYIWAVTHAGMAAWAMRTMLRMGVAGTKPDLAGPPNNMYNVFQLELNP